MKAATARSNPDFLERTLAVDDDLVSIVEDQIQDMALAPGLDVKVEVFEPGVGLGFDGVQNAVDTGKKFGIVHNLYPHV